MVKITTLFTHHLVLNVNLDVGDGNGAAANGNSAEDLGTLLKIDESSTTGSDGTRGSGSRSTGEGDGSPVSKGHEGRAFLVILNDPLGVVLTESSGGGEGLADGLSGGVIGDNS